MPKAVNALICVFAPSDLPHYDEEGDLMLGAYYQWIDADDLPLTGWIGPYTDNIAAENAAKRAFARRDFI